jgi:lysophospholipase
VWLDDVAAAAGQAREETGARRVHLLGVSWGGKLALACGRHRPDLYRSLMLVAPGIVPQVDLALAKKAQIARSLAAGRPLERFEIPLADPHLFTANPERIRYIAEDPRSLRQVTARFLFESRRLDAMARRAARSVRLATLLVLAEEDRIIDNEATRALAARMPADRLKIVVQRGGHHTLEFDPSPAEYFRVLVRWVRQVERSGAVG